MPIYYANNMIAFKTEIATKDMQTLLASLFTIIS